MHAQTRRFYRLDTSQVARYFVNGLAATAAKFGLLYGLIACLHGAVLYAWSDAMHFDYRGGFVIATCMQMVLGYIGNRALVFRA
jgi:putative flippase GtrA